jgi:hypothetical protein
MIVSLHMYIHMFLARTNKGSWLKNQSFLWTSFQSSKPDQVCTVVRMFTKQLPVGFTGCSAVVFGLNSSNMKKKAQQQAFEEPAGGVKPVDKLTVSKQAQAADEEEASYGSDSNLTDESASQISESDASQYSDSFDKDDDDDEDDQDEQSQLARKRKEKMDALKAVRAGGNGRTNSNAEKSRETSFENENRKPKSLNLTSSPDKYKSSFMKPTTASRMKEAQQPLSGNKTPTYLVRMFHKT